MHRRIDETYRRYIATVTRFHLAAAEACGLSPTDYQASSLLALDGPMTTGQLADQLALAPWAATRTVDRLIAAGLAQRTGDPTDRRRVVVEHTGTLPDDLATLLDLVRKPLADTIADLTAEQAQGLLLYLQAAERAYGAAARTIASPGPTTTPITSEPSPEDRRGPGQASSSRQK